MRSSARAEQRTRAAEQETLGQQRPPQRAGARAERRPNRELPLAPHRPREDQVRDVRARDDEDQHRGGEEHEQDGPRRRGDLIAQPERVDAEVRVLRVRFGVRLDHCGLDDAQFRARRLEIRSGRQAAEQLRHPMHTAGDHRRGKVMGTRDDIGNNLCFGWIRDGRFEDADDGR